MTSSVNRMTAIGHLGADPEMRYTPNGSPVTTFRIATSRSFNGQDGERREETEWFSVVTWNRLAETCNQYLAKGRQVYVEGRIQTRTWEGRDGQPRFTVEIVANDVRFLGRPSGDERQSDGNYGGGAAAEQGAAPGGGDFAGQSDDDDELPF